jgi:photosystem II stability/assembly factor-like uncharacterized protein
MTRRRRILVFALLTILAASCMSGGAAPSPSTVSPVETAPTTPPFENRLVVGPIDLVSPSLGLVAFTHCARGAHLGCEPGRLFATNDFGKTWKEVTLPPWKASPTQPAPPKISQLFFLDPSHGWIVQLNCGKDQDAVIRTVDGGSTWSSTGIGSSPCPLGAGKFVDFVDPQRGWLTQAEPTQGGASTRASTDGGKSWPAPGYPLPVVSSPEFLIPSGSGAVQGWVIGEVTSGGAPSDTRVLLFRSNDGAKTWTSVATPGPPCCAALSSETEPPSFFGAKGVYAQPSHDGTKGAVAFDTTTDGGSTWKRSTVLRIQGQSWAGSLMVQIASPTEWWVVAGTTHHLYRTTDAGAHWNSEALPTPGVPLEFAALASGMAWLTAQNVPESALYMTSDGGHTWSVAGLPEGYLLPTPSP